MYLYECGILIHYSSLALDTWDVPPVNLKGYIVEVPQLTTINYQLTITVMNKLTLNFLIAHADIYSLQDKPVTDVIEKTLDFLNSDEFMKDFLEHYSLMKYYRLDCEVKECILCGMDFWEACRELDILSTL